MSQSPSESPFSRAADAEADTREVAVVHPARGPEAGASSVRTPDPAKSGTLGRSVSEAAGAGADASPPEPLSSGGGSWRGSIAPAIALLILCVAFAVFIFHYYEPALTHPDANGYWAQGSLLATTGRTWFKPESPLQYVGMHWLITPDGRYVSRYPPGVAVAVAVLFRLFGPWSTFLLNPVLAVLSLVGVYLLALRVVRKPWFAVLASFLTAVTPAFCDHALQNISHMPVLFCLVWGMWLLLRWADRGSLSALAGAGLLLGSIPSLRYPEGLFGIGVAVFLLWNLRGKHRPWLHLAVAGVSAGIPLVALLARNQAVFGAFWKTGYSLTQEQTGFAWSYFREHVFQYIRNINAEGVGLFLGIGVAGMAGMCLMRDRLRRIGVLFVLIAVPITILYMFYYWGPSGMGGATMRFVLPTFPVYYVAAAWLLEEISRRFPAGVRGGILAAPLLLQVLWGAPECRRSVARLEFQKRVLALITRGVERHVPRNAVLLTNGGIAQHIEFFRKWRVADVGELRGNPGQARRFFARRFPRPGGRDGDERSGPRPMQEEKLEVRARAYEGLPPAERLRKIAGDLREWAGPDPLFFVGTESELRALPRPEFSPDAFEVVARVALPKPPETAFSGRFRRFAAFLRGRQALPGPGAGWQPPPPPGPGAPPGGPAAAGGFGRPGRDRTGFLARMLRRPGGGGPFGFLRMLMMGERQIVIARWTWSGERQSARRPARPPVDAFRPPPDVQAFLPPQDFRPPPVPQRLPDASRPARNPNPWGPWRRRNKTER